ncbi:hypothetical protein SS50377_24872 [Spironucleus salmonicida]|uniref:Uncharacterized protein n=1 Tax=Spironucleus salmonicida TaxID=348837 RepID=V6LJL5_9EUKA|nr:hypothetical protein SS50377_24872 [Spironucleus salmonicida]|eukprot:EST44785.1 Hypothetical protein SS50377_15320 [Spironucleus salmonicida]
MKLTISFEATTKDTEVPDNKKTVQQLAPILAKAFKLDSKIEILNDEKVLDLKAEVTEGMKLTIKEVKDSKATKEEKDEEQYEAEYEYEESGAYESGSAYDEKSAEDYSG